MVDRLRVVSDRPEPARQRGHGRGDRRRGLEPGQPDGGGGGLQQQRGSGGTTTLYTIDTAADVLNIQNPPNGGTQILVGALGVNATDVAGFDIAPGSNHAFASLTVGGVTGPLPDQPGHRGSDPGGQHRHRRPRRWAA